MNQEIIQVLNQNYKNLPAERANMMRQTYSIMSLTAFGDVNKLRTEIAKMKIGTIIDRPNIKSLISAGFKKSIILKIIDLHLTRFQMLVNISQHMNEMQIEDFAYSFLEEYNTESLEDFILFLNLMQKGQFGVIYNRLDKTVLFEYFKKYLDMKATEREAIMLSMKNDSQNPIMPMSKKEKDEYYKNGIEYLERQKRLEKEKRFGHLRSKDKSKENVKITLKQDKGGSPDRKDDSGKKTDSDLHK